MQNATRMPCFLLAAALAACAAPRDDSLEDNGPGDPASTESALNDGHADTAVGERSVRAGQLTLTVTSLATLTEDAGQQALIVKATTSRAIDHVLSFVPDDAYGEARLTGARTFEVVLGGGHEINTMLSGLPLFVSIHTTTGTIRDYQARIDFGAQFARFSGSRRIFLDAGIRPVAVADSKNPLRYRARVTTKANLTSMLASTPDGVLPTLAQIGAREVHASFDYDGFAQAFGPGSMPVTFTARFTDGTTAIKRAGIDLRVLRVGLSTEDAYDVWPTPTCTPETLACLVGLRDDAVDWGQCGDYRETQVCAYEHLCEIVPPAPFGLDAADSSGLGSAIERFGAACPNGGSWCHLDSITAYVVPKCHATPATIDQVVASVLTQLPDGPTVGTVLDDAGLGQTVLLGTSHSSAGPAVSGLLDGYQGATEAVGWDARDAVPCHNCTDFRARTIVFYPSTGWVFVLDGGFGYDS